MYAQLVKSSADRVLHRHNRKQQDAECHQEKHTALHRSCPVLLLLLPVLLPHYACAGTAHMLPNNVPLCFAVLSNAAAYSFILEGSQAMVGTTKSLQEVHMPYTMH